MEIWKNIFKEDRKEDREEDKSSKEESDEFLRSLSSPQEKILSENKITKSNELLGGISRPELITIKDDGRAIMKKSNFEKDPTIEPNRERAAYIVDRFLGFNIVPITVVRGEGKNTVSVQEFIENAKTFNELNMRKIRTEHAKEKKIFEECREDIMKVMLFDLLIGNIDRHFGNWIIASETIHAIDHGSSFGTSAYGNSLVGMSFSYLFSNHPVPENLLNNLRNFLQWEDGQKLLKELLEELLSKNIASLYIERIKNIIESIDDEGFISMEVLNKFYSLPSD